MNLKLFKKDTNTVVKKILRQKMNNKYKTQLNCVFNYLKRINIKNFSSCMSK